MSSENPITTTNPFAVLGVTTRDDRARIMEAAEDRSDILDLRLSLYARLARVRDAEDVEAFEEELRDRFGDLPDAAIQLIALARLRELARAHGLARIDAGPAAIALTPRPDCGIAAQVEGLEEKNGRLILAERIDDAGERLERLTALLG